MGKKITEYPAYTSPLTDDSLFDVSEDDGMNVTSSKITFAELKSEIGSGASTLSEVLTAGNTTSGNDVHISEADEMLFIGNGGNNSLILRHNPATIWSGGATRTLTLPPSTGTLATQGYVQNAIPKITITAQNSNYTADANDFVTMTAGATDKTVTLDFNTQSLDDRIVIKKVDAGAGNVVIQGNFGQTIDGAANKTLTAQWECVTIQCDGVNWLIVD